MMQNDEQLRYPIGRFEAPAEYPPEKIKEWIAIIRDLPGRVREAANGLTDAQLDTPYRPGGWTIRQVVHHLPDSHMNCLLRFKWALTEDAPAIKPYDEAAFALLPDYRLPVEGSLKMLDGIHEHLVALFQSLSPQDLDKMFYNPESKVTYTLKKAMALYAWHSRHHLAHITETIKKL